jgi:hypothetical protein
MLADSQQPKGVKLSLLQHVCEKSPYSGSIKRDISPVLVCSKLKAQSSKLKAQSSKLKAQSSKLKAQR